MGIKVFISDRRLPGNIDIIFLFLYLVPEACAASSIIFILYFFAIEWILSSTHGNPPKWTGRITLVFLDIYFSIFSVLICSLLIALLIDSVISGNKSWETFTDLESNSALSFSKILLSSLLNSWVSIIFLRFIRNYCRIKSITRIIQAR